MVVVEEGSNFPTVVGRKNRPRTKSWGVGRAIARVPSVRGIGRSPGMLPQLSVAQEYETKVHNLNAQLTTHAIFPLLDRPKPLIDFVKRRSPMIPRSKLLGVFGLVGQRLTWPPTREIGTLPKPMSILSGPEHPVHPQSISVEW